MRRFVSDKDVYAIRKALLEIANLKQVTIDSESVRKCCIILLEMLCEKELACKIDRNRLQEAEEMIVPIFYKLLPYDWYLKTDHWRNLREKALTRFRSKCAVCNSAGNLEVHHRTYANLGNEEPEDLTVLCDSCHELFHSNGKIKR